MASFSTVSVGDDATSSNVNQYADALGGQANVPISITGVNDAANWALDVRNQDGTNGRSFRARDSSGNSRFQAGNTSTSYVQADPDGSGLSPVVTLGHAQTLSSKTQSFLNTGTPGNVLKLPQCRLFNTAVQSIGNNANVALTWDSNTWDNDSLHSTASNPTRIQPSRPGLWNFAATAEFAANSSGSRGVGFRVDGATVWYYTEVSAQAARATVLNLSGSFQVSTGNYVEAFVFQNSGAALNVSTATYVGLSAVFLGSS